MADNTQEKTEKPTPKRLSESRQEGNVAQSQEISSAVVLMSGVMLLLFMGGGMMRKLKGAFYAVYLNIDILEVTIDSIPGYFRMGGYFMIDLLAPFALILAILAAAAKIAQVGWLFTLKPMVPKPEKLNPITGLKKVFSSRGFVELLKGVLKMLIVGSVGYFTIKAEIPKFMALGDLLVSEVVSHIAFAAMKVAVRAALILLILAILDLVYQKWKYKKDLKMTKQEVKDENKQSEGDPEVKGRIRHIQMKMSMNRMIESIPEADVVLTNPTHVAVVLKYDPETMAAPKVTAKGLRKLALKIKTVAAEHDIPIVEEPELARALYKTTEIGWEVPYDLFQAVAEVLAIVYRLKERVF